MANSCKFQRYQRFVSYDSGATWQPMDEYQRGTLIEKCSTDCGCVPLYRWLVTGTSCSNFNLNEESIKQVSYDEGATWENVTPIETASTCVEALSEECGYVLTEKALLRGSGCSYTLIPCDCTSSLTETVLGLDNGGHIIKNRTVTSATIGDCVIRLGEDAFYQYLALKKVTLPHTLKSIGEDAFSECMSLEHLTIPSGVCVWHGCSHITTDMFNLKDVIIEDGVPLIPERAFVGCSALTSVTIPDTVAFIGDEAFKSCESLTSVTIGSGIEKIDGTAFVWCTNLQSISIKSLFPPIIGENVFDYTNDCPIYVPIGVEQDYKNNNYWRNYSARIVGIEMNVNTPPAQRIKWISSGGLQGVFDGSDYLINTDVTNYQTTTQLWVQEGVTWIDGDISNPTPTYTQLQEVSLPDTLLHIGSAFYGCAYLTTVTIPNSVEKIQAYAFTHCQTLSSVTIGCGVQFIGAYAFNDCPDLVEVTCLATTPPEIFSTTFGGMSSNKTFYVPASSVSAYQSATNWSDYASRIQPIPTP